MRSTTLLLFATSTVAQTILETKCKKPMDFTFMPQSRQSNHNKCCPSPLVNGKCPHKLQTKGNNCNGVLDYRQRSENRGHGYNLYTDDMMPGSWKQPEGNVARAYTISFKGDLGSSTELIGMGDKTSSWGQFVMKMGGPSPGGCLSAWAHNGNFNPQGGQCKVPMVPSQWNSGDRFKRSIYNLDDKAKAQYDEWKTATLIYTPQKAVMCYNGVKIAETVPGLRSPYKYKAPGMDYETWGDIFPLNSKKGNGVYIGGMFFGGSQLGRGDCWGGGRCGGQGGTIQMKDVNVYTTEGRWCLTEDDNGNEKAYLVSQGNPFANWDISNECSLPANALPIAQDPDAATPKPTAFPTTVSPTTASPTTASPTTESPTIGNKCYEQQCSSESGLHCTNWKTLGSGSGVTKQECEARCTSGNSFTGSKEECVAIYWGEHGDGSKNHCGLCTAGYEHKANTGDKYTFYVKKNCVGNEPDCEGSPSAVCLAEFEMLGDPQKANDPNRRAQYKTDNNGDFIELTQDYGGRRGGAFSRGKIDPANFEAEFDFFVGIVDKGADGLVWTIADSSQWNGQIGAGGGCMGSCGIEGLAIEFDTWYNKNKGDQTAEDHVAVWENGVRGQRVKGTKDVSLENIEDNKWHTASIKSKQGKLIVTVDGVKRIDAQWTPQFAEGRFGWTAATGGARNKHRVRAARFCSLPSMAGVSGDPFVVDESGAKVQFFLPLHQEMELLTCDGLQLYGRAFGTDIAGDHQQWFDMFRIKSEGKEGLIVSVKGNATELPDEADVSATPVKEQALTILNVVVEGTTMQKTGAIGLESNSLVAAWHNTAGEIVQFSHGSTVIQLRSAVAQKFTAKDQQALYTHLDLRFVELDNKKCSSGILAEIWGTVPMTQATAGMLQPPKSN